MSLSLSLCDALSPLTLLQNSPLYIRTFEEDEDLGFHYIAHVALDVVDEKMRQAGVSSAKDDMYLGFLGPIEDYRVYVLSCLEPEPVAQLTPRCLYVAMDT